MTKNKAAIRCKRCCGILRLEYHVLVTVVAEIKGDEVLTDEMEPIGLEQDILAGTIMHPVIVCLGCGAETAEEHGYLLNITATGFGFVKTELPL